MSQEGPDFEISEASISGTHQREDIFNQGGRSRRRVFRVTAQISLIVAVALIASIVVVRAPLQAFLSANQGTPTPVVTPRPLAQVDIQTNVTSHAVTVNGKAVPYNPNATNPSIDLTKQHSVITLTAPPFHPITCTVDTTELGHSQNTGRCNTNGGDNGIPALDMNFTIDDLPTLPRQQFDTYLTQKIAQLSTIQAQVPARAHYATGSSAQFTPTVALAATPLRAQAQVAQTSMVFDNADCSGAICPGNNNETPGANSPPFVGFTLQLQVGWGFFDGAGRRVATYLPPTNSPNPDPGPDLTARFDIQIYYAATTGWSDISNSAGPFGADSASSQLTNGFCEIGSSLVYYLIQQQSPNFGGSSSSGGPASLIGCLMAFSTTNAQQTPIDPKADPTKDSINAWFLVHFGAVLAVNDKAHALLPQLPLANAQDVTDVRQAPPG